MPTPLPAARLRLRIAATLLAAVVGLIVLGAGADASVSGGEGTIPTVTSSPSSTDTTPTTQQVTTTLDATTTTEFVTTTTFQSTTTRQTARTSTTRAQATSTTLEAVIETTTTTGRNLLVAGDGTDGAESTTTSTTTPPAQPDEGGLSESSMIWLIVAGLVGIAGLIGWWTIRYWRATAPIDDPDESVVDASSGPPTAGAGGDDPTTVF